MAEYVTGLERTQEYIDRLQGVLQFFETLPQEKRNPVQEAVDARSFQKRLRCCQEPQAFNVHLVRQLPGNPGCDGYRLLQPGF